VQVYSQCGARGVRDARGAVFRDIVLIRRLKLSVLSVGSRRSSLNEFQAVGPTTANAHMAVMLECNIFPLTWERVLVGTCVTVYNLYYLYYWH